MSLEEIGRRASECDHFRVTPGMLLTDGSDSVRVIYTNEDWFTVVSLSRRSVEIVDQAPDCAKMHPDLSDPATLGCLLALVEEAWECPADFSFEGAYWLDAHTKERVWLRANVDAFEAKTRAEALVAALEAAP